jgi:hypothetical protein
LIAAEFTSLRASWASLRAGIDSSRAFLASASSFAIITDYLSKYSFFSLASLALTPAI